MSVYLYQCGVELDALKSEEVVPVEDNGGHVLPAAARHRVLGQLGHLGQTLTCKYTHSFDKTFTEGEPAQVLN